MRCAMPSTATRGDGRCGSASRKPIQSRMNYNVATEAKATPTSAMNEVDNQPLVQLVLMAILLQLLLLSLLVNVKHHTFNATYR